MYRLKLFGGVALASEDGPIEGRAVQRRRLALLTLLAFGRSQTVPRERIAVMLWPEADSERARHLVSDSVYRINQALHDSAVLATGDDLQLDLKVVSVDALDFAEALRGEDWARCVALYGGEFLDGFCVADALEFERWADGERLQFSQDYRKALEALAVQAESRSDDPVAVDYWRRAAVQDPHSSRIALALMRALARAGERSAAIKHARIHTELVRQEVDAEADPQVAALAEQLARLAPAPSSREVARETARANARPVHQVMEESHTVVAGHAALPAGDALGAMVLVPSPSARPGDLASDSSGSIAPASSAPASSAPASSAPASSAPTSAALGSIAPVTIAASSASATAPAHDVSAVGSSVASLAPRAASIVRRNVPWRSIGGATLLLLTVSLAWFAVRRSDLVASASVGGQRTIAVLPFANQSGDRDFDYMSDGITDELISTLGNVSGIRVTSRTSVFALKGTKLDIREIARRLGVDAVLEGSVRRSGDQLRVTAQLVTGSDGYQLWSESFDRRVSDVLDIQQQIAAAIVDRLQGRDVSPTLTAAAHPVDDPAAYDLYLQGRYAWHQRTEAGLRQAVDRFSAAVARAPSYARAYAGLGDAYAVLAFYDYVAPRDAFPRARAAAERAIALDSTLAAPHATLGYVDLYFDWAFERSDLEFKRSIALDPSYSLAHQWYGNLHTSRGHFAEAEREMRLSQELDPLSLIANAALSWVYLYAGRYNDAVLQCERTLVLDDRFALAWLWRGMAETERGELPSAVTTLRHAAALSGETGIVRAALARAYALDGSRDSARAILASLDRRGSSGYVPSYEIAKVYLALGDRDAALASLSHALDDRAHSMVFLAIDPQFAPLRQDPRFIGMRDRIEHAPAPEKRGGDGG